MIKARYDYHLHTNASGDSAESIDNVIKQAMALGLEDIAITDHYDYNYPDPSFCELLDFDAYGKTLDRVIRQYADIIRITPGIELGLRTDGQEKLNTALEKYPFEFVIGSIHSVDSYPIDMSSYRRAYGDKKATVRYYEYLYEAIKANISSFDVCGHLNVIDRYVDNIQQEKYYMHIIEDIFKLLIENDKGIEVNTSCYRYGMGARTTPTLEMLRIFRQLGGEIITIGSDAHRASDVGNGLDRGLEMIITAGFRNVCTYKDRWPIFNKID
jgi:histidinol-phosphatase (PHP family)